MIHHLYRLLIELSNRKWSSYLIRAFTRSKVSRIMIPSYIKMYNINTDEIEQRPSEFQTLHDFFIRKLKGESRPVNREKNSVVAPVDSILVDMGKISFDCLLEVKGKKYSLLDMLGRKERIKNYIGGWYLILYLSPGHYHRIHSPYSGKIIGQWTLGNRSYPVNKYGLKYGRDTLAKNFRKIMEVQLARGRSAIVNVGAMFVNSIEITHQEDRLTKGEELGYFSFGSTVILLFENNIFEPLKELEISMDIKMGQIIGYEKA